MPCLSAAAWIEYFSTESFWFGRLAGREFGISNHTFLGAIRGLP